VGRPAVKKESMDPWRGENGNPPTATTDAMISTLLKMRTMKILRMSAMPFWMRCPSWKA
jgi:hypothetical protein